MSSRRRWVLFETGSNKGFLLMSFFFCHCHFWLACYKVNIHPDFCCLEAISSVKSTTQSQYTNKLQLNWNEMVQLVKMKSVLKYRAEAIHCTPLSCFAQPRWNKSFGYCIFWSSMCVRQSTNPHVPGEGRDGRRSWAREAEKRSQRVVTKLGVPVRNSKRRTFLCDRSCTLLSCSV